LTVTSEQCPSLWLCVMVYTSRLQQ